VGIIPGSPTAAAGLMVGDIIYKWGDTDASLLSRETLRESVASVAPSSLTFQVLRRADAAWLGLPACSPKNSIAECPPGESRVVKLEIGRDRRAGMRIHGNQLVEVIAGSPADQAQLRAGDVVEAWDGKPLTQNFSLKDAMVNETSDASFLIVRSPQPIVSLTDDDMSSMTSSILSTATKSTTTVSQLTEGTTGDSEREGSQSFRVAGLPYLELIANVLDKEQVLNVQLILEPGQKVGMRVQGNSAVEVFPDMPAARAGIQAGDVIEKWDDKMIQSSYTIKEALAATLHKAAASKSAQEPILIVRRQPGKLV